MQYMWRQRYGVDWKVNHLPCEFATFVSIFVYYQAHLLEQTRLLACCLHRRMGDETHRDIVSFRLCVRTAVCKVRMSLKSDSDAFLFSLLAGEGLLPFSHVRSCYRSLEWIQVNSNESKWDPATLSESKWNQLESNVSREIKWVQARSSESKRDQISSREINWVQVSPRDI